VNSSSTPNGPYAYGSTSTFPSNTYNSANYWVDVVFNTSPHWRLARPRWDGHSWRSSWRLAECSGEFHLGGWNTLKMRRRIRVPHPFPVLGKGAGFEFAFFCSPHQPVNPPHSRSTLNFDLSLLFT